VRRYFAHKSSEAFQIRSELEIDWRIADLSSGSPRSLRDRDGDTISQCRIPNVLGNAPAMQRGVKIGRRLAVARAETAMPNELPSASLSVGMPSGRRCGQLRDLIRFHRTNIPPPYAYRRCAFPGARALCPGVLLPSRLVVGQRRECLRHRPSTATARGRAWCPYPGRVRKRFQAAESRRTKSRIVFAPPMVVTRAPIMTAYGAISAIMLPDSSRVR
jgi:hypothetical protein